MTYAEQGPYEKLHYRQTVVGDTVSSATASIRAIRGLIGSASVTPISATTTAVTVMVAGLSAATLYKLTIHVTGASGQEFDTECDIKGVAKGTQPPTNPGGGAQPWSATTITWDQATQTWSAI